ncbi:NfeD family protein [Allitabrizicola rongguiensis]|uniref:NfeD family protein n=1 Tax=Alitabrizicola rongguiensis TaxID=2909234 RepID=UPI002102E82F
MWTEWWVWVVAGLVLAILEVVLPGYIFAGFAVGAVLTGGMTWLGLLGGSLPAALVVFAVLSLGGWAIMRVVFGKNTGEVKRWDKDING